MATSDKLLASVYKLIGTVGIDASRGLSRTETAKLFSKLDQLFTNIKNGDLPDDLRSTVTVPVTSDFHQMTSSAFTNRSFLPPTRDERRWHTT